MNDDSLSLLGSIPLQGALGKGTGVEHYSVDSNKHLRSIAFMQGDGMALDTYLDPTQKGWRSLTCHLLLGKSK